MKPEYYVKKPVVVEAVLLTDKTFIDVLMWLENHHNGFFWTSDKKWISFKTLEGDMRANIGDWVIRGIKGEFYPCKPDIFDATYELSIKAALGKSDE